MALLGEHLHLFQEILAIPEVIAAPVLMFGFQEVRTNESAPPEYRCSSLLEFFQMRGMAREQIKSIDLFDPRADYRYDMNQPIPESLHESCSTFIDLGSLEHIFDTRVALENCLRSIRVGGHYILHTPVHGFSGHGFHVFDPKALTGALELNNFVLRYQRYSAGDGRILSEPIGDTLLWLVARKVGPSPVQFQCPQQQFRY